MDEFNEDLLHEYLDGTLDHETRQAIEAYLANSSVARAQLAELQALFSDLDTLPELSLARDLSAAVVAEIGQETAVATPWPRWLWGVLLGQAFVVLLLLGNIRWLLQDWLGSSRQLAAEWMTEVQLPTLAFLNDFWLEVTAVWQQPFLPDLTIDLPVGQWALLFGLALVVWLAGNRLLFTPD